MPKKKVDDKKAGKNLKSRLSDMLELPREIVLNLPLINIIGNEELTIENYKGVVEYAEERIRINTSRGIIKIEGKKLTLKQITAENISVSGVITKFEYLM